MNRLQSEYRRLYLLPDGDDPGSRTRAMVLAVDGPGSWDALSNVWQGVQGDLLLPAPGIAVSGSGYQLWFSVAQPIPLAEASAFLASLRSRFLGDSAPVRMLSQVPQPLPPVEVAPDRWSAFVAPDLARLFVEESWLDIPPGEDAQADLLSRLQSMRAADVVGAGAAPAAPPPAAPRQDPRQFLLAVMSDPSVALALRIEAAKALLPYSEGAPRS